jgi:hypothetical protein
MKPKTKRYQSGGLAAISETAQNLMANVDSMANTINYGEPTSSGAVQPVGFNAVAEMKKGGMVKKKKKLGGYVKAADGIATKGKTKGRFV